MFLSKADRTARKRRDQTYNFAAAGTICGGGAPAGDHIPLGDDGCSGKIVAPKNWDTNLAQIQRAIDNTRQSGAAPR